MNVERSSLLAGSMTSCVGRTTPPATSTSTTCSAAVRTARRSASAFLREPPGRSRTLTAEKETLELHHGAPTRSFREAAGAPGHLQHRQRARPHASGEGSARRRRAHVEAQEQPQGRSLRDLQPGRPLGDRGSDRVARDLPQERSPDHRQRSSMLDRKARRERGTPPDHRRGADAARGRARAIVFWLQMRSTPAA
jgi:hypothetical protein